MGGRQHIDVIKWPGKKMDRKQLFEEFKSSFKGRKFVAGLLLAIIDFLKELGIPESDINSYSKLIKEYPKQEKTSTGRHANTLIVATRERTVSLRPFYNAAERFFMVEKKRYDYPSCAPHATQAWIDYIDWIDTLSSMSPTDIDALRQDVVDFVLDSLPSHEYDPTSIRIGPPIYRILLEEFDFAAPANEPSGAAFQGAVFGFVRADNPHLQVEIDKVRTGSKRKQRVGDIDAWEGERLALSAEVKNLEVSRKLAEGLSSFYRSVNERGAIGMVVGQGFEDGAREIIIEAGIKPIDIEDLIRLVELWDPAKQQIAIASFEYYAAHVEKNHTLKSRLREFIDTAALIDNG